MGDETIDLRETSRGFMRGDFKDRNGDECSIQESSAMDDDGLLWLGCNEGVHHHVTGECLARMHLTRTHVRALLPLLQHFADTGRLPPPSAPHRARGVAIMGDHKRRHVYGHIPWWYWTIRPQWWTWYGTARARGPGIATLLLAALLPEDPSHGR